MKIGLITPAPPRSRYGNRVTALRWARILRQLGHRVAVAQTYEGEPYDVLVALHARRSHEAMRRFREERPRAPLILALTGTDLYGDIRNSPEAQDSLELATRMILLQPKGIAELPLHVQDKALVIYQSVSMRPRPPATNGRVGGATRAFTVCVIGHLREVKDPFRAALAARLLPASSRLHVLHIGGELENGYAAQAQAEMAVNPRYRWIGEKPRWSVFRYLQQSRACVLSSYLEGGANVVSEAIAASVPVLASRISGSVGILGEDYPGYFEVGDTEGLARLLGRAETDPAFLADLAARCARLAPMFEPAREKAAWAQLLEEVVGQERGMRNEE
jgi:putative glycosyltransferase (TIGR04348 family)